MVGHRRGADRGEGAVGCVGEAGDEARGAAAGSVVGVGDEQLVGVGRAELAPELAVSLGGSECLGVERRAGRGGQEPVAADGEAVDLRAGDAGADEPAAVAVEEDVAGLGVVGSAYVEPGIGSGGRPG